ncbi:MAG: hypothetical protein NT135_00495 [Candidatus Berkelbacteria bacterium]|nr:hypothetical protein [Candidatus Berkelbacteria bacterium]
MMSTKSPFCLRDLKIEKLVLPFDLPMPNTTIPVQQLVTHSGYDSDNLGALWAGYNFGSLALPGFDEAPIDWYSSEYKVQSAEAWEKQGVVLFDCGGGRFDHAPHGTVPFCSLDTILEFCGVNRNPELQEMVQDIRDGDLRGTRTTRAHFAHFLYIQHKSDSRKLVRAAFGYLNSWYTREIDLFYIVAKEFQDKAMIHTFGDTKIAVIETDVRRVAGYALSKFGGAVDVVIQRQSDGHCQVLANQGKGVNLANAIGVLRYWNMAAEGIEVTCSPEELTCPGSFELAPWYMAWSAGYDGAWGLFNGSDAEKEVRPTVLDTQTILKAVALGIVPVFHRDCPRTHCIGNQCGYHMFNFDRCRVIRRLNG